MSSNTREIKDIFYLVALQGINYVMPLVVFPYLMVTLGAEKFGYIGLATAVTQYLMLIVDFGFNLSATKRIAIHKENPEKIQEIFWSVLLIKIGLLFISFVILLIIAIGIPQFRVYQSTLLIFFLMVVANTFSFVWFFQGLGKIRDVSIVNVISKLLILPLVFLLVKTNDDYLIAASIQSAVYVLSAVLIVFVLINKKYVPYWKKPNRNSMIFEIKSASPIFWSNAASSIYVALFAVVLAYFSTAEEVGRYTAAEKIVRSFCYLIFLPVSQAFFPKLSALSQSNSAQAGKLMKKISLSVGIIMLLVFFVLFFFSDYFMLFLGKDYNGIDIVFKIMAIIPFFVALGGVFGQLGLLALGNEQDKKRYQNVYLIAGVIALVSVFVLTPAFQSIGAATALFATEFIVFVLMGYFCRNTIRKILV